MLIKKQLYVDHVTLYRRKQAPEKKTAQTAIVALRKPFVIVQWLQCIYFNNLTQFRVKLCVKCVKPV